MANYIQPVVFELNQLNYGIDIKKVASIEHGINYIAVPNTAPYIKGIANLRGNVIPVFDLKKRFGIEDNNTADSMIILNLNKTIIGILVDAVKEINEIPSNKIVDMPKLVKQQDTLFLDRVANVNDKIIVLLDIDILIPEEDQESYNQIAEKLSSENESK